ncbi:hypothetical protein KAR91_23495, partial [Candidatus Pacearchaeota archaeon]|nr:hypothetical protein [Candidatus Pacearchaeota archaeon]
MQFVLFLDALDSNDIVEDSFLGKNFLCKYNPGLPKVTPNVVSQIMTGNRPEDMPFVRPTAYKKERSLDLEGDTILHYAAKKLRVFQYGIPMCSKLSLPDGSFTGYDHFKGNRQGLPAPLVFMPDTMNVQETDPEHVFHARVDQTSVLFSTMRTIARNGNFDIMFIGYTMIDQYCHGWHPENKKRLLEVLDFEIEDLARYGDVFFFSDHGNTAKTKDFFI